MTTGRTSRRGRPHRRGPGPIRIVEVELGGSLPALRPGPTRLLVRRDGRPLGFLPVTVPLSGYEPEEVSAHLRRELDGAVLDRDRPAPATPPLSASVVVTACRSSADLIRTLRAIEQQSLAPSQLILVDNRPATSGIANLLERHDFTAVTLVEELVPGLSSARNAGLAAATGDVVAFTDDDVLPDRTWLEALVEGFSDSSVACVTGLILPLELETEAQCWFEEFGGFGKGFQRLRFDLDTNRHDGPLYPYAAGVFGSGANGAFRVDYLRAQGGFDERLGTGTPARGGEDLDAYLSVVRAGHTLLYEPAALLRHQHHRERRALRRQIHGYGVGLAAMVTNRLVAHPEERLEIARRLGTGLRHLLDPGSAKNEHKGPRYPRSLTLMELAGVARGPYAYWRSARLVRRRRSMRPQPDLDAQGQCRPTITTPHATP